MKRQETNQSNKEQRIDKITIGNTVYTVIAEEKDNTQNTPLGIVRNLIERNLYSTYGETERTCCLQLTEVNGNVRNANG